VRGMTLAVLDHATTWPYLDPAAYPTPPTIKLIREILSDPYGTSDFTGVSTFYVLPPLTHLTVHGADYLTSMSIQYADGASFYEGWTDGSGSTSPPRGGDFAVGVGAQHAALATAYGQAGDVLNGAGFIFQDGYNTGMMGLGYDACPCPNNPDPPPGQGCCGTPFLTGFEDEIVSSINIMGSSGYYRSVSQIIYGFRRADSYCPGPIDTSTVGCVLDVHRGVNTVGQHLFDIHLEDLYLQGFSLENRQAFRIYSTAADGLTQLYACSAATTFLTTAMDCEGSGFTPLGTMGWISATQLEGTKPLYRLYTPITFDHLYTTDAAERDQAIAQLGYNDEGITGYVW